MVASCKVQVARCRLQVKGKLATCHLLPAAFYKKTSCRLSKRRNISYLPLIFQLMLTELAPSRACGGCCSFTGPVPPLLQIRMSIFTVKLSIANWGGVSSKICNYYRSGAEIEPQRREERQDKTFLPPFAPLRLIKLNREDAKSAKINLFLLPLASFAPLRLIKLNRLRN